MHIIKTKDGDFMAISNSVFENALMKDNISKYAYIFIHKNRKDNDNDKKRPKVRRQDVLWGYDIGEVTNFVMGNVKKMVPIIKKNCDRKW